jgi:hypothetical protein
MGGGSGGDVESFSGCPRPTAKGAVHRLCTDVFTLTTRCFLQPYPAPPLSSDFSLVIISKSEVS